MLFGTFECEPKTNWFGLKSFTFLKKLFAETVHDNVIRKSILQSFIAFATV